MWNVVLDRFVELKHRFINIFDEDILWKYGEYDNCIIHLSLS
jgi:hypothetical protein